MLWSLVTILNIIVAANCHAQASGGVVDSAAPRPVKEAGQTTQPTRGEKNHLTTQPVKKVSVPPTTSAPSSPETLPEKTMKRPIKATGDSPPQSSSGDAKTDTILDRLEASGKAIKGLSCGLKYTYVTVAPFVGMDDERQVKEGRLFFTQGDPNARFLVHFTKQTAAGVVDRREEYHAFDGIWYTERNDKAKTYTRRQLVRKGDRIDPFELGKGPFPLPFGQKRSEILRQFKVTLRPFLVGDPKGSSHLKCIPRPATELAKKYSRVDIFVDRKLDLPIRIVSERLIDGNRIEVNFLEIDIRSAPAGSRFIVPIPDGFDVTVEPLPD